MAVQANTNVKTDFAKAQSIDFVTRFNGSITKLQELLGLTRKTALSNGSLIKTYTSSVTLAAGDGVVAEGDIIPLSKVETKLANTYELAYKKYRKAVTMEAIQRSGFDTAVTEADNKLMKTIQAKIRAGLLFWQLVQERQPVQHCRQPFPMHGGSCRCSLKTMQLAASLCWSIRWMWRTISAVHPSPRRTLSV